MLGYFRYLAMLVWPFDLGSAPARPQEHEVYLAATLLCGLALAEVSAAVLLWCRTKRRYVLTGWFWFLVMIAPSAAS